MKDIMQYKGYYGAVHYNDEDELFYGKIEFIRSLVSYEGQDVASLKGAFQEAVEDYVATCQEQGIEPEESFKGSFNVRIGSDLHRQAFKYAKEHDINLNHLTKTALQEYLSTHP
jgi:predicted HicB family RNase H-like nuclease